MNKQKAPKGIEWTRVYDRDGYTWNPVGGCHHGCQWQMPDGTIAECYAKTVSEKFGIHEQGFEHHYFYPERLREPVKLKKGAGIFLDSMSDLMGHWVADSEIQQVLDVCHDTPQHIYFLLTKNAIRLKKFKFPDNVWIGASSPPDFYKGEKLSQLQKDQMLKVTLDALGQTNATVKWMSFEPLSTDYSEIVKEHPVLNWAVIGAASQGRKYIPPNRDDFQSLMAVLKGQHVPVFFKGNMESLPDAKNNWLVEFPPEKKPGVQLDMFQF